VRYFFSCVHTLNRIHSVGYTRTRPREGVACFPNRNCISILSFVTSSRLWAGKHEATPMLYMLPTCQLNNAKILIHWLYISSDQRTPANSSISNDWRCNRRSICINNRRSELHINYFLSFRCNYDHSYRYSPMCSLEEFAERFRIDIHRLSIMYSESSTIKKC